MAWTVERCLREDPKLSRADLDLLKEWHNKQPHLPPMTDLEILTFLHSKKYDVERAKERIDKYFTIRTDNPDVFRNRDMLQPTFAQQGNFIYYSALPERDSNGFRVIGFALRPAEDLSSLIFSRLLSTIIAAADIYTRDWPICPGYVLIIDTRNLQFGHFTKVSLTLLRMILTYTQEAHPCRVKGAHLIHMNSFGEKAVHLVKPFLREKTRKLIQFHSGEMKAFYETFPRHMLPHEFGGTCGSLLNFHEDKLKLLLENREQLLMDERRQVNHSLRPERMNDVKHADVVHKSFKKLDID